MKRSLLILLAVLAVVSLSCNLLAPKNLPAAPNAEQITVTEAPTQVEAQEATKPPAAPEPTETTEAPSAELPTAELPTAELPTAEPPAAELPTETVEAPVEEKTTETAAGPVTVTDKFDRANSAWSDPVIVTTQASGRDVWAKITSGDGRMRFAIEDKETYIYKFYQKSPEGGTTITAEFQNKGAINTGIALVCKANEDHTSWFEARVSAADSNYWFYQYDKKRKEVEGKNPYIVLGKGHMKVDEYYPAKLNKITFTCEDGQLSIDVNGKKKGSQTIDASLDGTMFGLGVMSADIIPATIDFDSVIMK